MTTYTSLLSHSPQYGVEDWIVTIRENHSYDLPYLSELREMVRRDAAQPYYRARVVGSFRYLLGDFQQSQHFLDRTDRELINRVISIFRQELS
ncbi:MAG TPA: hypothetical protein PKE20_06375 [Promineifilum sp.]|nr:hypothetical protein [Promineifilum sp.]